VVCVVGLAAISRQQLFPGVPTRSRPELLGKRLAFPGLNLPQSPGLALVVAARSDCHFCADSLPFYHEVDRRRRVGPNPVPLFFVTSEPVEKLRAFRAEAGISPDGVISVHFRAMGVTATPTFVVVDSAGIIKRAFYGKLSDEDGRGLLGIVEKAAL
jgi:hypothetical protein